MRKRQRTSPPKHTLTGSLAAYASGTTNSISLDTLPTEVLHFITSFLEAHYIGNLRLTGRSIASKVTAAYFRRKTISLTVQSLTTFAEVLQPNGLACLLKNVTVICIVSNDIPEQGLFESLLTKAFVTLKESAGGLRSLSLDIVDDPDYKDPSSDIESRHAAIRRDVLKATITALQESGLAVRDLNLFGNLLGESASIDLIRELSDPTSLTSSLKETKSLSLSITCDRAPSQDSNDPGRHDGVPGENIATLARLLDLMQSLEALDLLWYKTWPVSDTPESFFFDSCFKSITSTKLKSCSLRGIYLAEETLRAFLQQTSAKRIVLQEIHLQNGTFASILGILTRETESFEYFHLDDLFQEDGQPRKFDLVYFKVKGKPKFKTLDPSIGPSEIVREGDEVRQKLDYTFSKGRPAGSGQKNHWHYRRKSVYGSPARIR